MFAISNQSRDKLVSTIAMGVAVTAMWATSGILMTAGNAEPTDSQSEENLLASNTSYIAFDSNDNSTNEKISQNQIDSLAIVQHDIFPYRNSPDKSLVTYFGQPETPLVPVVVPSIISQPIIVPKKTIEDYGIPTWILIGIAMKETRSHWRNDELIYVNQKRGTHGERGPFQMIPDTFAMIKKSGESFSRLSYDMEFATQITVRYLNYLHNNCHSWKRAVASYNGGLGNPQWDYELCVEKAGGIRN